jgi:phasin family protein
MTQPSNPDHSRWPYASAGEREDAANWQGRQTRESSSAQDYSIFDTSHQAFDIFEQLMDLGSSSSRQAWREGAEYVQEVLSAKTPQDLIKAQQDLVLPLADQALSYQQQALAISKEGAQKMRKQVSKIVEGSLKQAASKKK